MNVKSEISKKVFITGRNGFIGRNLSNYLLSKGYEIVGIDSRIPQHKNFVIKRNDIFIDCSRIKNFDINEVKKDEENYYQLLKWVVSHGCTFLRIGSNLEVALPNEFTNYSNWSKQRTKLILNLGLQNKMKILLVPNIFGGDKSNSVLELILQGFKEGKKLKINNPEAYRDFLSINLLLPTIESFLMNLTTQVKSTYLITTGICHQVGSIQEFVYSKGKSPLISKKFESDTVLDRIICENNIQEYLKQAYLK